MDEVAELDLPTQENVHADLRSVFQGAVKLALETVLDEVVRDLIGARDVRSGTYLWSLPRSRGRGRTAPIANGRSGPTKRVLHTVLPRHVDSRNRTTLKERKQPESFRLSKGMMYPKQD
jgi:hypothetical protein